MSKINYFTIIGMEKWITKEVVKIIDEILDNNLSSAESSLIKKKIKKELGMKLDGTFPSAKEEEIRLKKELKAIGIRV